MMTKKSQQPYPLPETTYSDLAFKIYSPLLIHENVVLLCPPLYGKDHNIRYLWQRSEDRTRVLGSDNARYHFSYIPLGYYDHDPETAWLNQMLQDLSTVGRTAPAIQTLQTVINELLEDRAEPVFFINIPESFPDELLIRFLRLAQQIYYLFPNHVHFILSLDDKWEDANFFSLIAPYRSLFQNIVRPQLYTDQEVTHFVHYWLSTWDHTLSEEAIRLIVRQAGGILLLAKAAVRLSKQYNVTTSKELSRNVLSHPNFIAQVNLFVSRLTMMQQKILKGDTPMKNDQELQHLIALGIANDVLGDVRIRSRAVAVTIRPITNDPRVLLQQLTQETPISNTEKQLLYALIQHPGQLLTRDSVAQLLWGNQSADRYSDWALDQHVSRLRNKLKKSMEGKKYALKTQKKKGIYLELI